MHSVDVENGVLHCFELPAEVPRELQLPVCLTPSFHSRQLSVLHYDTETLVKCIVTFIHSYYINVYYTLFTKHNLMHFWCVSLFILNWQPLFSSLLHTQGIVYYPISLIFMFYYSLMTSLIQGRSRNCRAGVSHSYPHSPAENRRRTVVSPISACISPIRWDTRDWQKTAMQLNFS